VRAAEEAALTDDEVVRSYLGGILAGGDGSDNGVSFVAQISRLGSAQLRLHYVIYRQLWHIESASATPTDLRSHGDLRRNSELFLPRGDLDVALLLKQSSDGARSLLSTLDVLAREDLIAAHQGDGGAINLDRDNRAYAVEADWRLRDIRQREFPSSGVICSPTPAGIELFLRGCGSGDHDPTLIRQLEAKFVRATVPEVQGQLVSRLPLT